MALSVKQFVKAVLALAVWGVLFVSPARAIDREGLYYLQYTMQEHGFDPGKRDGYMGPSTRRAMAAFAEQYNLPEDPESMRRALISRSAAHSYRITEEANISDAKLEEIRDAVATLMKDPSSVQIQNVRIVEGPEGRSYCGEFNGKNSYGAYAGFTGFYSLPGFMESLIFIIEKPESNFVFWNCALAIPKRD